MIKIKQPEIDNADLTIFGEWLHKPLLIQTEPYPHIVIDNFLTEKAYETIYNSYPNKPDDTWWYYNNPIEVKYTFDKIDKCHHSIQNYLFALSHSTIHLPL